MEELQLSIQHAVTVTANESWRRSSNRHSMISSHQDVNRIVKLFSKDNLSMYTRLYTWIQSYTMMSQLSSHADNPVWNQRWFDSIAGFKLSRQSVRRFVVQTIYETTNGCGSTTMLRGVGELLSCICLYMKQSR